MAREARIDRLEAALVRVAEAQARADERMARLEEFQARTEERLARLEEAVTTLVTAQARMEERLGRQEETLLALTQAVGRWTDLFGFTLEDLAREVAPAYLAQHFAIRVEALDRRFFQLDGQEIEVDLYGEGRRDGEAVAVVGEVRSRIYGRDVEAAFRQAERLASQLPGAPVTVLFGFVIHPSAREAATRLGAVLISSSGR